MPSVKANDELQNFDDELLNVLRKLFLYEKESELSVVAPFLESYNKRFGSMVASTVYSILNGSMNPRPSFIRACLEHFDSAHDLHEMFDVADAGGTAKAEAVATLRAVGDMIGGAIARLDSNGKGA